MIRGAIFDFDGTLFDSMPIWDTAGEDYLRSVGRQPRPGLRQTLKPMDMMQSAAYCQREYQIPLTIPEIIDGINRIVEDFYLRRVQPKPGAQALLEGLKARGVRLCVATATDRYLVEGALKRCGLDEYFCHVFTCTEVGRGKDDPLIYRKALEMLRTSRQETLVFEDALHALATAKADGFLAAAVYDSSEMQQDALRALADLYLADFSHLDALWEFVSG